MYPEQREREREKFGLVRGMIVEIKDSLIWLFGETRSSAKLVPVTATNLD